MKKAFALILFLSIVASLSIRSLGQEPIRKAKNSNDTTGTKLKAPDNTPPKEGRQINKTNADSLTIDPKMKEEMEFRRGLLIKEQSKDSVRVK
jgi:hypothetical protein